MMSKPKFPLNLPKVARVAKSAAQDLAFGRIDLESAIRFLDAPELAEVAARLRSALADLPPARVHHLGCRCCTGDVPLDVPDLLEDRICRPCADAYDRAVEERRAVMRAARLDLKRAA